MSELVYVFDALLTAMYGVLFLFYVVLFLSNHSRAQRFVAAALPAMLVLHAAKLAYQGVAVGHCPIMTPCETLSFTACALCATYLVIERRHKYFATGAVFVGMILVVQGLALVMDRVAVTSVTTHFPLGFHAPIALMGIALLVASALYGAVYLAEFYLLKSKHLGLYLKKMPSLEAVERMQEISTFVGVVLLGISAVSGFVIALAYNQQFSIFDPMIVITAAVLAIYGYLVVCSRRRAFSGRRKSTIAILGVVFALISITIVRLWTPTFHRF